MSEAVKSHLITKIKNCPFYAIIIDTTSDISRVDHISIVIRWVDLNSENCNINESFLGFLEITDNCCRINRTGE